MAFKNNFLKFDFQRGGRDRGTEGSMDVRVKHWSLPPAGTPGLRPGRIHPQPSGAREDAQLSLAGQGLRCF